MPLGQLNELRDFRSKDQIDWKTNAIDFDYGVFKLARLDLNSI